VEDHKKIKELLPSLKQKNVELISISNDQSYQHWNGYLEKNNYSWLQFKKSQLAENIITQLGISTYPTYILLNKERKIVFSTYSLNEVLKQVD
jgi:alkyl hydroperoxide reductase subunit AhpC